MIPADHTHRAPSYRLVVDGIDISPTINGRLVSLVITENRGIEADTLDLTLADHDGAVELPPTGAEITAAIGWDGELVEKGSYIVDEIEHSGSPDQVLIRARSADMRGGLPGQKSRSWHDTTVAEIVEEIAKEHGLEPKLGEHLGGIRVRHIDQTSESDLHLLTRLAERYDAIAAVKAGRLLFIPAAAASTASGEPLPPITLRRHDADQHRYVKADRDAYTGVRAYWNDTSGGRREKVVAGTEGNPKELRPTYATKEDALAAARAEFRRLQRGAAEFSLVLALGRAELAPETPITAQGWKPQIDGTTWIAVRVKHDLNDSGLISSFQAEASVAP
ncbi:MAG: phage late control D family protein [Ectothiorhodospiraceae bacterium]|nr:phage late control D family protein [Ectothiorhodospiraceae bacterium]